MSWCVVTWVVGQCVRVSCGCIYVVVLTTDTSTHTHKHAYAAGGLDHELVCGNGPLC